MGNGRCERFSLKASIAGMFWFERTRNGQTEVFEILVPEGELPDAENRFGSAVQFDHRERLFHEVGTVVLIHEPEQTEYVVLGRGSLTGAEIKIFYQQLEMLAGRKTHQWGGEIEEGWFVHDAVRTSSP